MEKGPVTPTTSPAPANIQVLMEAEKEASKIVQRARQYRVTRLKDARTEAQAEIEALKQEKQREYEALEQEIIKTLTQAMQQGQEETQRQVAEVEAQGAEHREAMVKMIVEKVLDVKVEPHPNARKH